MLRLFAATLLFLPTVFAQSSGPVVLLKLDGSINPSTAEYLVHGIQEARDRGASCVLIELNTPGGLLKSTRTIVSAFLDSKVPIIVFVAPGGSQAGSAGVFITMAAHIAAMAPGTNIGAAHPVTLQGEQDSIMSEKATNDAAAFIRSIAEKRHRNLTWAEDAVRGSKSITETEALKLNVIDIIARDRVDLLRQIDGRTVQTAVDTVVLATRGARIEETPMTWAEHLLDILSDPNIAYILFMLGVYGLLFELYNPGSIFPGVVGVISLVLAFYSLHTLPINYAGVALMVFAVILFLLEIKITSHGLLAVGGAVSLFLGSIMLIRTPSVLEVVQLSWTVIIASVIVTTLFFTVILALGLKAQRRKPTTGVEGIVGEIGDAVDTLSPAGSVRIHGELWQAIAYGGDIPAGQKVRVVAVHGLTLHVESTTRPSIH